MHRLPHVQQPHILCAAESWFQACIRHAITLIAQVYCDSCYNIRQYCKYLTTVICLQGTLHLVDAAKKAGVKKFVLMSSLLTNGRDAGQGTNPNFIVLNLFGGVLDQKLKVLFTAPVCYQLHLDVSGKAGLAFPLFTFEKLIHWGQMNHKES